MSRVWRTAVASAGGWSLLALVAGCAGLHSNRAATQTYVLAPPVAEGAAARTAAPPGAVTLQVLRPLAAPGLDTDQIALLRAGQRLDYYAASRWPAALPELLQTLAVDALRAAGRFRAVQPDATAFAADDVLQIEIRHCEAVYAAEEAPVVRVELLATLGHQRDRALVGTVSAASETPAGANRMQAVVAAFQEAVNRVLAQLAAELTP